MRERDFSRWAVKQYTCNGRHFLNHIVGRGIRLKAARPDDVEEYLRKQRQRLRGEVLRVFGEHGLEVAGERHILADQHSDAASAARRILRSWLFRMAIE